MSSIGVYSYILWGNKYRIPYREMIKSVMMGVDEIVVVTDSRFADGTLEHLQLLADKCNKIKVYDIELDLNDPGIDGKTKALARSKCKSEVLMQMDADEIVREQDLDKLQSIAKEVLDKQIIIGTGVVNWFNGENFKWSAAGWTKERFSPNVDLITHGIPYNKRIATGRYYRTLINESDGAGYISRSGSSMYSDKTLCNLRKFRKDYRSDKSFYIHHYSWYDVTRKWNMNTTWNYFWGLLCGKYSSIKDYEQKTGADFWCPGVLKDPKEYKQPLISEMKKDSTIRAAKISHPSVMKEWVSDSIVYVPRMITRGIYKGYSRNM